MTFKNKTSVNNYIPMHGVAEDLMSFETMRTFAVINFVFICGFIGLFGTATNAINMVVFCKQGFKNTTTICFMALAISDMGCLITVQWSGVCMNPLLFGAKLSFAPLEIHASTGGWPHITFARITGWITVYITAERCLCITAPLAVRNIITPRRTTFSLFVIFFINIVILVPEYCTCFIGWKFYPKMNRTLLGIIVTSENERVEGLVFFLHALLVLTSFVCVTVLTSVLVVKLEGASRWRRKATHDKAQSETMSKKDQRTTRMVIVISGLLIVMNSPGIILSMATFCEPQFGIYGIYTNFFHALWSFGFIFNATNSSVNIFMYYNMSSKYRDIFNQIFLPGFKRKTC